ncbi:hypothetical protein ACJX0J_041228 [Zea mays]
MASLNERERRHETRIYTYDDYYSCRYSCILRVYLTTIYKSSNIHAVDTQDLRSSINCMHGLYYFFVVAMKVYNEHRERTFGFGVQFGVGLLLFQIQLKRKEIFLSSFFINYIFIVYLFGIIMT